MTTGALGSEAGQWLGGVAAALSFVVLAARRPGQAVNAYAAQSVALAAAAGWQAWLQGSLPWAAAGLAMLAVKGVGAPVLLHRVYGPGERLHGTGTLPVALGAGLVVLAVGVAPRDLALALAVVLLGLLAMATRREPQLQAIGLLSLENGVALAAMGATDSPAALVLASTGVALAVVASLRRSRPA